MVADSALVSTALDFIARASSTSEVLTLNLTNLLILIVLKALIFGFGLFSVGGTGRSADDSPLIQQSDLTGGMCFMMYASGEEDKYTCIQRSACEDPKTYTDYYTAASMIYKVHKLLKVFPFPDKYYYSMMGVKEASTHGAAGGDCSKYEW